jgi:hypothetical protein
MEVSTTTIKKLIDLYSIGTSPKSPKINTPQLSPITAFPSSPNLWKVAIVLEELGLEYNIILLDMFSVKKAPFTDLNSNRRTPAIVDHENKGFIMWEVRFSSSHICFRCKYESERGLEGIRGERRRGLMSLI